MYAVSSPCVVHQALKQKQLDDLDALLGEFGVEGERTKPALFLPSHLGGIGVV